MALLLRRLFLCWWGGCGGRVYTTTCTYPDCVSESMLTHPPCHEDCSIQATFWKCSICGRTSND